MAQRAGPCNCRRARPAQAVGVNGEGTVTIGNAR